MLLDNVTDVRAAVDATLDPALHHPRLREEIDAINWLLEQVSRGRPLPVVEAEAVAHSLYVDMCVFAAETTGSTRAAKCLRLVPLNQMREYNAVHAINVAMLSMAMGSALGFGEEATRSIGLAGLLHDIGMVCVPVELLAKSEQLDPAERELVKRHPAAGARIIVEADAALDLAAVVAYEHHIRPDGGGYPTLSYRRQGHRVSRLVQVCDNYHALRSPRPYRDAWPNEVVKSFLQQRAGTEFDHEMVTTLIRVVG